MLLSWEIEGYDITIVENKGDDTISKAKHTQSTDLHLICGDVEKKDQKVGILAHTNKKIYYFRLKHHQNK